MKILQNMKIFIKLKNLKYSKIKAFMLNCIKATLCCSGMKYIYIHFKFYDSMKVSLHL